MLTGLTLNACLHKKSHRMSNRGKPTAMYMAGRRPPFALDVSLPTESDTAGAAGRVELALPERWRLQAGFDYFRLTQDARRYITRSSDRLLLFSDAVWGGVAQQTTGGYVHFGRSFDRGEVQAAVRLDGVASDAGWVTEFFREQSGGTAQVRETNANFSLAGRYELGSGFVLAGGLGRAVRTANALERYADRFPSTRFQIAAEFMGTPGLRPEASLQGDLNLAWTVGRLRLDAGAYARSIDQYITVATAPSIPKRLPLSPPVVFRYANGEGAFFRGWHLGMRVVSKNVELRLRSSKTLADDRTLLEPVLGIGPIEMDGGLRFLTPSRRLWAEYTFRSAWDQRRVAAARFETPSPGFTVHAVRAGMDLWSGATLHVGVENLGDKRYFEHLNSLNPFTRQRIPEMGRAMTVGFSTTW